MQTHAVLCIFRCVSVRGGVWRGSARTPAPRAKIARKCVPRLFFVVCQFPTFFILDLPFKLIKCAKRMSCGAHDCVFKRELRWRAIVSALFVDYFEGVT